MQKVGIGMHVGISAWIMRMYGFAIQWNPY